MSHSTRRILPLLVGGAVLLSTASPSLGQVQNGNQWPVPRLASVFPPGGKAGATIEVVVNGVEIDRPDSLWFSHPGIKGTPIDAAPAADPKKVDPKKAASAPVSMAVTIDSNVPPGHYDVRVVNARGISNPRVFVVGAATEVLEKEPNNDVDQPQKVSIGCVVNGAIGTAVDVDYYQIACKKGERLLLHVAGPSIDSRLHPEMAVFDLKNRRLAYGRAVPDEDLLLDFIAPADGDYLVRLNHFTYTAGSSEYFYRLAVGTGPWVDAVFPPIVEPGKPATLTVHGRNLPGGQPDPAAVVDGRILDVVPAKVVAPADPNRFEPIEQVPPTRGAFPGFEFRLGSSNARFVGYARAPIVAEIDDNDSIDKAQTVKTPCEIVGRIEKLRDRDWYSFAAKKGDVLIIDAGSQRYGAPTDLYFKLVNAAKKLEIVMQDDAVDTLNPRGYYTASRDPSPFRFVVPEDGDYRLLVASHNADIAAGPAHVYSVRIAPENPDFLLIAMPADDFRPDSCVVGRGGVTFYNVFAQRLDGFTGDIRLAIEGLPDGVVCPPQILGGGVKHAMLAVVADDKTPERFDGAVKIVGVADIAGKKVVREARPATVTWGAPNPQNNSPTITRHDRSLMFSLRDRAPIRLMPKKDRAVVLAGDKVDIPYVLTRHDPEFKGNFQVQPVPGETPTGVAINNLTFAPGKDEQTLTLTTQTTAAPGVHNLVIRGFAPIAVTKGKNVNAVVAAGPVTLVIVPKQVGVLTLDKSDATVPVGGETALTLKLTRKADYAGTLKVTLLPENAKDVSAAEATIAAGQNEVKVIVKVAAGASPGTRANLTLRAVAVVEGIALNHDVKLNVNVVPEKK